MLTKRLVDAATPRQAEYHLFDGEIPGLALRVHPNSSKTYALFYRTSTGRKRTLTLGRHGAITPEQARRFARGETLIPVSGRAPSPRERIESRRVPRDAYVAVDANRYPVPLEWAGCKVEVHIQAEEIWISRPGSDAVRHRRLSGKHQLARWEGPPRPCPVRSSPPATSGPPRFDPVYAESVGQVETRPLASYQGLVDEVRS